MTKELRTGTAPIPEDLHELLNEEQLRTLRGIEHFGWELNFIRRPLFQNPVPVLINRESKRTVVLEENGTINETPDLDIRECKPAADIMKKNTS